MANNSVNKSHNKRIKTKYKITLNSIAIEAQINKLFNSYINLIAVKLKHNNYNQLNKLLIDCKQLFRILKSNKYQVLEKKPFFKLVQKVVHDISRDVSLHRILVFHNSFVEVLNRILKNNSLKSNPIIHKTFEEEISDNNAISKQIVDNIENSLNINNSVVEDMDITVEDIDNSVVEDIDNSVVEDIDNSVVEDIDNSVVEDIENSAIEDNDSQRTEEDDNHMTEESVLSFNDSIVESDFDKDNDINNNHMNDNNCNNNKTIDSNECVLTETLVNNTFKYPFNGTDYPVLNEMVSYLIEDFVKDPDGKWLSPDGRKYKTIPIFRILIAVQKVIKDNNLQIKENNINILVDKIFKGIKKILKKSKTVELIVID